MNSWGWVLLSDDLVAKRGRLLVEVSIRVSRMLPLGMIQSPMTGEDSIPDVAHLDTTGSYGRL